mgnify:CR=1 FL=1
MHYERGAKKILRFFREEFHKVRFQKIEERPRGGGEVRQRRDLRDRGTESGSREGRACEGVVSQQPSSDARDGACDVAHHVLKREHSGRLYARDAQRRGF